MSMVNIIITGLLIMPWVVLPFQEISDQMRAPKCAFLDFFFMAVIISFLLNGAKSVYKNKYLSWLIGWVFFSISCYLIIPFFLVYKNGGVKINGFFIEPAIHIFLGIFAVYAIITTLERKDFERIARMLCFSGFLVSIVAILQRFGIDIFGKNVLYMCDNRVAACFDNPNIVGSYLALCLPFYFLFFKDKKYILWGISALGGIWACKSNLSYGLALFTLLSWFLARFRPIKWVYLALTPITIMVILLKKAFVARHIISLLDGRWDAWVKGWDVFHYNPVFGQGLGFWRSINPLILTTNWQQVHNDWLERMVEIGVIGIVLLGLLILNLLRNFKPERVNNMYLVSFLVFLILMLGSFPMEIAALAQIGLISFCGIEKMNSSGVSL